MSKKAIQELQQLRSLLQLERQEEERLSEAIIKETPLEERRKLGVTWYPIVINKDEIGFGQQLVLEIERTAWRDTPHRFQQGQSVAIFSLAYEKSDTPQAINGVVKKVRGDTIELILTLENFPDWFEDGKLGLNLLYNAKTFNEMERALDLVIKAKNNRLATLRNVLMGYSKPRFDRNTYKIDFPDLNPSQNQAIHQVLTAEDVTLIHGPPGTGKTTTTVRAIHQTLKHQKQVLVCAPSNTAVDLLSQKLGELGVKVVRMGNPARIDGALQDMTFDAQVSAHPEYKRLKQIRREAQITRQQASKFKRSFGEAEREERKEKWQLLKDLFQDARNLEKYISRSILDEAQVIAATLVGVTTPMIRHKQFETVFIDEAAQALAPATWIPITKAKRVVFAGDHCQLPPTVKSREAQDKGLMQSLFERCMIKQPTASTLLDTQYRMNEQIMEFSSQQFYKNALKAHESVAEITLGEGEMLDTPMDFIDTAGAGFDETQNQTTLSRFNPQEADMLLKYLNGMLENLAIENEEALKSTTIGIISPYKAQVIYLKDNLENYEQLQLLKDQIAVHTVDGFQGQERNIIGISLVRSNEDGEIGFLSDTRRTNVAMTRAKQKLVMIGNSATLAKHPFYQSLMEYVESIDAYKSVWELMY